MVDYSQTVKKIKIEMPVDDKDTKLKQEQQTPPVKKEVHILYE